MWEAIADAVSIRAGGRVTATGRSCREKFEALCSQAKAKQQSASQRSGDSESWDESDQLLFDCNDEQAAYAATSKESKEREEKATAERTGRQSELKEDTMQSLSQRSGSGRRQPAASGDDGAVRSEEAGTVDLTEERGSSAVEDSEGSATAPTPRKRQRTDMRTLLKDSMELHRSHFTKHEVATEEQLALQRQHLSAIADYNKTIDKRMGESNSLFAQMINKM